MSPTELKGKRFTVVGGARSGLAVSRLLVRAGAKVFLTDKAPASPGIEAALDEIGVTYEFGGHTPRALEADYFAVSPGVPSRANLILQASRSGIPVFSEIEISSWFCKAPIVAITGANGKTTTTSLTGHLFSASGRNTFVAGNIGFPFADYVLDTTPDDVVVLEVSSFQLDHVDTFRPRVSLLLNITPDHLDRYENNFELYARSKARIFENQREGDVLVYNQDDPVVLERLEVASGREGPRKLGFSQERELDEGAFVRGDSIFIRLDGRKEYLMKADELSLRGKHNLYNALAAVLAGRVLGVSLESLRSSLTNFKGVPHRLEFIREIDGVRYINDSKATNVNAVWYALESFKEHVVLIAGGRDKGNDYSPLIPFVKDRVRAVVAIGESADKVVRELGSAAPATVVARSMEEAISEARRFAKPGDVVLLSPACASFDMFDNYEHRGDTFRRLVEAL